MATQKLRPVDPDSDRLLVDLKGLTQELSESIADGRFEKSEEIDAQIELISDRLFELKPTFSPIILDACNARAKLAIHLNKMELAAIHLSFVSDVCLNRPSGKWTTQFADCLECESQVARRQPDWDLFAFCLEKCATVRAKVLGPNHRDTLRAAREWETFLDIATDPALD